MTGAEPPVVRAGIMGLLAFTAQAYGREQEGTIALIISALLMLLISPLILFDIGFQLSFTATAGIIWLYPWFRGKLARFPGIFREAMSTTLAAQVGVTPLILTHFGQVSFLAPLVNGLVYAVVPYIMSMGLGVVLLSLVFLPLGQLAAWLTWPLLTYFVKVIEVFGRLPWAAKEVGLLSWWWVVGYYGVVGYLVWRMKKGVRVRCEKRVEK
jgi:competence protein ComEC